VYKQRLKLLVCVLVCVNFFVFLSFVTVLLNSITQTIASDVCNEVYRPAGLFDVMQSDATFAFNDMLSYANSTFNRVATEGCTEIQQVCAIGYQACENVVCNIDFLVILGNDIVLNDKGRIIALKDCPTQCQNPVLRNATVGYADIIIVYDLYVECVTQIATLLLGLVGPATQSYLHSLLCDQLAKSVPLVYTGAGLLMVGLLLQMAFSFRMGFHN